MVVHGHEATTKYEELIDEGRSDISLPHILKIMPYAHFMALTKCFHVKNYTTL
jgi:hypothetical protein